MKKERIDPTFKRKFGIQTSIVYLKNSYVEEGLEKRFAAAWKRFYKKSETLVSDYRTQRFYAFFRQLGREKGDDRYTKKVAIRFIDPKVGYGVFAKENIPPYSTLHHYTGIFRLDRKISVRHDSTFSFNKFSLFSIDAMKAGNWTRFMNHSDEKNPKTNVIAWELYLEEGPRIVFTSGSHGIKKGAQLLYSYGEIYWKTKNFVKL
jgi:SET domain-containing protein